MTANWAPQDDFVGPFLSKVIKYVLPQVMLRLVEAPLDRIKLTFQTQACLPLLNQLDSITSPSPVRFTSILSVMNYTIEHEGLIGFW